MIIASKSEIPTIQCMLPPSAGQETIHHQALPVSLSIDVNIWGADNLMSMVPAQWSIATCWRGGKEDQISCILTC